METPVIYSSSFIADPDDAFLELWNGLDWERRPDAPRREYFASDVGLPYTYGTGPGQRTYHPRAWTSRLLDIRRQVEAVTRTTFELVFLNGYNDERDSLGWHADDSPEMDDARPIAIVSLGAERLIYFRRRDGRPDAIEQLLLENGSLCIMSAGMQDTHQHRIPKGSFKMGPRISLTFRGSAQPAA